MHHPISFRPFSSTSTIVNKCFLKANAFISFTSIWINRFINSCGLPKSTPSYSIWPYTILVFPPSLAIKIPFFISHFTASIYIQITKINIIYKYSIIVTITISLAYKEGPMDCVYRYRFVWWVQGWWVFSQLFDGGKSWRVLRRLDETGIRGAGFDRHRHRRRCKLLEFPYCDLSVWREREREGGDQREITKVFKTWSLKKVWEREAIFLACSYNNKGHQNFIKSKSHPLTIIR